MDIVDQLNKAAAECAAEKCAGWGNTASDAARTIIALRARLLVYEREDVRPSSPVNNGS